MLLGWAAFGELDMFGDEKNSPGGEFGGSPLSAVLGSTTEACALCTACTGLPQSESEEMIITSEGPARVSESESDISMISRGLVCVLASCFLGVSAAGM
jgi:hypothetical protein